MKSTHEPFDRALKGRLRNYTEEPDKDLWTDIVSSIVSIDAPPGWIVWVNRLSLVVIAFPALFFFNAQQGESPKETAAHLSPSHTVPDSVPAAVFTEEQVRSGNSGKVQIGKPGSEAAKVPVHPFRSRRLRSTVQPGEKALPEVMKSGLSPENQLATIAPRSDIQDPGYLGPSDRTALVSKSPEIVRKAAPQNETPGTPEKQRARKPFSLYFTAMPTFGYQRIQANKKDDIKIHGIKHVPAFSMDRLGVRLEAGTEVPLSKHWTVFGGFLYFQRKQTIDYTERHAELISDGNGGRTEYRYLPKSIEYELKNAGLQVGFTYRLWMARDNPAARSPLLRGRKLSHVLGSGIEFHKALNTSQALEKAENFTDPSTYVFVNVYYRMQYPNVGKLRAIFQPTLNYSFYINENLNAPFYVKPYGLGLNFGCTYHFR